MTGTQELSNPNGYDTDNMVFQKTIESTVPGADGKKGFTYKRVPIATKVNVDDESPLLFPTTKLFSFGLGVNTNKDTGANNGFTLPLCLHSRDGATDDELAWVETFNAVVDKCKDYIVDNKEKLEQYDLEMSDLKKFNPLYYKRVKGEIDPKYGPTLYAKCITTKDNVVKTIFNDPEGNKLDYRDLTGKYCFVKAVVKIESIFIGSKISLQVKLHEAIVWLLDGGMKSLLLSDAPKHKPQERLLSKDEDEDEKPKKLLSAKDESSDGEGSVKDDDDNEDEEEKPAKKPVKRTIRKTLKK